MMFSDNSLIKEGHFIVGCNYWASHAGTRMWKDWQASTVAEDLKQLAAEGLEVVRVFPLWPDFQPLTQIFRARGVEKELRVDEKVLGHDALGRAGISPLAMERFQFLADEAEKNNLKLVVGLVTGWMSGRLFVPPAFERLNVLTDPRAIQWEVKFIRAFVNHFKAHSAIHAWDLGNECNCLAPVPNREAAWVWTHTLSSAIRVEDNTRPVISGMHSLTPGHEACWTIQDQGELTDLLTTHPYPVFTPHCDRDPVNEIRNGYHATAESRLYADISGRPCIGEEVGTLGPTICSEAIAADYARTILYSLWAHDCHGLMWWCAYDQDHLRFDPYDRNGCERELGLIRKDRDVKPVLNAIGDFSRSLKALPFDTLPQRQTQAVCLLSEGQDSWGAAYGAFILAKQAGFDLVFQYYDQPLKEADLYIVPSIHGAKHMHRTTWEALFEKAISGATLYVSAASAFLEPYQANFGFEVQTREAMTKPSSVSVTLNGEPTTLTCHTPHRLRLAPTSAEVLGRETDGNPFFLKNTLGKGTVYFFGSALEEDCSTTPGIFHHKDAEPIWKLYREIAAPILATRTVRRDNPMIGITEHALDETHRVIVAINPTSQEQTTTLCLAEGWQIESVLLGGKVEGEQVTIPHNNGLVLSLRSFLHGKAQNQSSEG